MIDSHASDPPSRKTQSFQMSNELGALLECLFAMKKWY